MPREERVCGKSVLRPMTKAEVPSFLIFGLFVSLVWHVLWTAGLAPAFCDSFFSPVVSRTIYAGSVLVDRDFVARDPGKVPQGKSYFGVPEFQAASLEKVGTSTPKPELLFRNFPWISSGQEPQSVPGKEAEKASRDIVFGMGDYERFLYQADFSDLKRVARREELRDFILFDVFLKEDGSVKKIRKISGSGDPSVDLFIQSKIANAVFRQKTAPRGSWITLRFRLR